VTSKKKKIETKKVNHNTLNTTAEQNGRKVLGSARLLKTTGLPRGKGTVEGSSTEQQKKSRWS
jgi:hypothetical protein